MAKFLVWCVLLVLSWPLALLALVVYPLVWLLLIPFRIVGIAVDGGLGVTAKVLRGPRGVLTGEARGSRPTPLQLRDVNGRLVG